MGDVHLSQITLDELGLTLTQLPPAETHSDGDILLEKCQTAAYGAVMVAFLRRGILEGADKIYFWEAKAAKRLN